MTRRLLEVETLAAFDRHIGRTRRLNGWFVQSLDLTGRSEALLSVDPQGAVFLGCRFDPGVEQRLRAAGALLFPRLPDLPFDPYRARLYDAAELYGTGPVAASPDAVIYAWARSAQASTLSGELATTLHDHAISDALNDATADIDPRSVVGIMGGHAQLRTDQAYRAAAQLGASLAAAGRTVLTGGGPGAMEAGNLGGYLSAWPGALDEALAMLGAVPTYRSDLDSWTATAYAVRERWPAAAAGRSLAIPTWFYGHEPTNLFATAIAKYFANALREDTLLHRCRGGIVYLPGEAGTVQEIFQAVTENFYAADSTEVAPLVLVGVDYWTTQLPAWPLLHRLGANRPMAEVVHCVDDIAAAVDLLVAEVSPAAAQHRSTDS
jgi:predicted Rossmann-fold nucleotide-binding protein